MSPLDLPPDLRSRLRGIAIAPRRPAMLGGAGVHASRNRGGGMEFAQYRAYEQGDEPRLIDWKLYARSDKFFVRDAERESPVVIWMVIDASASMAQADLARPEWSRFDAARQLAACLMQIALAQGDRFGLIVESAADPLILAPGSGARHRDRIALALARATPAGAADWARHANSLGERIGTADVAIVLSDGFDEELIAMIERLAASGRDLRLIRILTGDERDFPFDRGYRFRDAESGASLLGGSGQRDAFLARFAAARAALDTRLDARGIAHAEHFIDGRADAPIARIAGGARAR
ncbi:DUF58 domain-containing protein [Sphingomonas baiyangensis]|uniref:DUF58 domain-containing protein n=1 Tax=Sphingomonas baiyangensis TaxID=2572576 RepID=A0A4U1L0W9_9SPHN|nr:DUF58 domain-containing protein [Sphingomonas baiyangensis]TKD50252.1 DUF58 domain-containing protein [Sphingomonas baiyangensis]